MRSGAARVDEAHELEFLRADARYRRERRDLYRARLYAGRAATRTRLAELDRLYEFAAARLSQKERELKADDSAKPKKKERSHE